MNEIKKISLKVFFLIKDIALFGFNIIKQVSLPTRKRRGNVLSSLFAFFIGVIERLRSLEHGVFSMAALFRNKYVKRTIFVTGFILFLVSLFEWSAVQRAASSSALTRTEQLSSNVASENIIAKNCGVICYSKKLIAHARYTAFDIHLCSVFHFPSSLRRFIHIRSLRI